MKWADCVMWLIPHLLIITFQSTSIHFNPPIGSGLTQSTYDPLTIHFHATSIKCRQDQSRFHLHTIHFKALVQTGLCIVFVLFFFGKAAKSGLLISQFLQMITPTFVFTFSEGGGVLAHAQQRNQCWTEWYHGWHMRDLCDKFKASKEKEWKCLINNNIEMLNEWTLHWSTVQSVKQSFTSSV